MKDQVIMSKVNGEIAIAVPLFRLVEADLLEKYDSYVICLNDSEPIAFAVDTGNQITLMNAQFLQDKVEWLGDL